MYLRKSSSNTCALRTQPRSFRAGSRASSGTSLNQQLTQLARLYGVQTSYVDMHKRRQEAQAESVFLALRALGAPLESTKDVSSALAYKRDELRHVLEPVIVVWDGRPHLQKSGQPHTREATIVLEDGTTAAWPPRSPLPHGYHRLHCRLKGERRETLVISAPTRAHFPVSEKTWGVFAPAYALHSKRSVGAGDLTDMESLIDWMHGHGGRVLSTLPLLSTFLETPFEPQPLLPHQPAVLERVLPRSCKGARVFCFKGIATPVAIRNPDSIDACRLSRNNAREASSSGSTGSIVLRSGKQRASKGF